MNDSETKIAKLKEMLSILNEGLTKTDFINSFKEVLKQVALVESSLIKKIDSKIQDTSSKTEKEMMDYCMKEVDKMMREHKVKMEAMDKKEMQMDEKMDSVKDGKNADERRIVQDVLTQLPPPPLLEPEVIRDKLEVLKGDGRLSKNAIQGIEELEKKIDLKSSGIRGGARGVMLYVDGTKRGQAQMVNLVAGAGVALTYSYANGRNDITISASNTAVTVLTATGTIDDTNTAFTFVSKPAVIILNGATYRENKGWTWNAGTLTATLSSPAGVGSDLYGIG